jgi:hypothetical protein
MASLGHDGLYRRRSHRDRGEYRADWRGPARAHSDELCGTTGLAPPRHRMSLGVEQTVGETIGLGKERSRRRAGGGVDMAAGTRHAAAQDRGGTDSDAEYVTTSFE